MFMILAILFVTSIIANAIDWKKYNWAPSCDFSGNDLKNVSSEAKDCGNQCKDDPEGCTHFTWTNFNNGTCWMKKNLVYRDDAIPKYDEGAVCGVIKAAFRWRKDNWAYDCDFLENNLANVESVAGDCRILCESNPDCTHFTWTNFKTGTCWMKKNLVHKNDAVPKLDESALCGVTKAAIHWRKYNPAYDWAYDCDFMENDLINLTFTGEQCGGQCKSTPDCTHFTWTNGNNGTCRMKKNAVSKNDTIPKFDEQAICGVIHSEPGHRTITFLNRCSHPIRINPFTLNGFELRNGIVELTENARIKYNIPDSGWKGRFWPKVECDNSGNNYAVGQSSNPCPKSGCKPPADTKVEFSFPDITDTNAIIRYDLILVDGYSLPIEIIPDNQKESCIVTNCALSLNSCPTNEMATGNLRVMKNGRVVQCLAPCKKWTSLFPYGMDQSIQTYTGRQFCCQTPQQCIAGLVAKTKYVKLINCICPMAYGYAYDEDISPNNCPNPTNFDVMIC